MGHENHASVSSQDDKGRTQIENQSDARIRKVAHHVKVCILRRSDDAQSVSGNDRGKMGQKLMALLVLVTLVYMTLGQ